jgi:hypothetical protein
VAVLGVTGGKPCSVPEAVPRSRPVANPTAEVGRRGSGGEELAGVGEMQNLAYRALRAHDPE